MDNQSKSEREIVEQLNITVAIVSAIIERRRADGEIEILVQTRWKPNSDPEYSGTLEISAGGIERYENVYVALQREVYEETGLRVLRIYPDIQTDVFSPRDDEAFAFVPFCCQQQTKGGVSRVGFVFICEVEDRPPRVNEHENKDIRWMGVSELRQLIEESPEQIFTFQLPALSYYLRQLDDLG